MNEACIEVSLYLCCTATNCFLVGAVAGNTRMRVISIEEHGNILYHVLG
jgi:hypothetical protein